MERGKTKWRFEQRVAQLALCPLLGLSVSSAGRAELLDRVSSLGDPEESAFSFAARAAPPSTVSSANNRILPLPVIQGQFLDFKLPDESRFWELHGVTLDHEMKRGVLRLTQHLIGTPREKASVYKFCAARKDTAGRQDHLLLTPDGIACLYWRWMALKRQESIAKNEQKIAQAQGQKVASKRSHSRKKKGTAVHALRSSKDFFALADLPYDSVLKKIEFKSEKDALRAIRLAQESPKDCRLTSARAAVLRDLENFLPSEAIWKGMNEVYQITSPCLLPTHEAFEVVNGRLALLHLDRKLLSRGAALLDVTLQAPALDDEQLYLFWRGYLEALQSSSVEAVTLVPQDNAQTLFNSSSKQASKVSERLTGSVKNPYWDRLNDKFPLTLHALVADQLRGIDSYERYAQRPAPAVTVYSGQVWSLENVSHLMASLFWIKGNQAALERLSRLLDEGVGVSSFESAMFRVKFFEQAGQPRAVIKMISQSLKAYGSKYISLALLEKLYPVKFRQEIAQQAAFIDPALIFSLIRQESSFNPRATSPVGARGLMQVMPNTARRIDRKRRLDLYDPSTNIRIGSKYLHILRKQHQGDYPRLIASYNAGPNNIKKWEQRYRGDVPLLFADLVPFPETRHYITGLMRHMYWYRALVSHTREASGVAKINWSWSLADVLPRSETFGLALGERLQLKTDVLPWATPQDGSSTAAD
jgi:soluble lytic murein transglycosylase-like protein